MTGNSHEVLYTFLILKISDESCREDQDTCFIKFFSFFENRAVYEINVEEYGTARQATYDNIIRRMRIACWIPTAINTRTEYVILPALRRQKWLGERASVLLIYVHCFASACSEEFLVRTGIHMLL
jgi:hypothetical protein